MKRTLALRPTQRWQGWGIWLPRPVRLRMEWDQLSSVPLMGTRSSGGEEKGEEGREEEEGQLGGEARIGPLGKGGLGRASGHLTAGSRGQG